MISMRDKNCEIRESNVRFLRVRAQIRITGSVCLFMKKNIEGYKGFWSMH